MTSIWAHRGASAVAPENTLAAFQRAYDLGADGVELDVQLTADDRVVCLHDETLDRTTSGSGPLARLTLDEVRALDASYGNEAFSHEKVPTLEEIFGLLGPTGMTINIELKNSVEPYPGLEQAVLALVEEAGMAEQVVYSTFNHISAAALARSSQPSVVGLLFEDVLAEPWHYADHLGARALHPNWKYVSYAPETVARCHDIGLAVNVWTVDDPTVARTMADLGADALITNRPDVIRRAL